MLLADLRKHYRRDLAPDYSKEEIEAVFFTLLRHYLDLPRFILGLEPDKFLLKEEEAPLLEALDRLKRHEPVQYITGTAEFMDMELEVNPEVLIPRPETEGLVRWLLDRHPQGRGIERVLDAGTGSGCIALSLARAWPESEIHALDFSPGALATAKRNARQHRLELVFHHMDLCNPGTFRHPFDLIVSNPPYIPMSESGQTQARVRESEPQQALFVPDSEPLKFYHCLLRLAWRNLRPGGMLAVETHFRLCREVATAFKASGFLDIQLKKDIFGKERYVWGIHPG